MLKIYGSRLCKDCVDCCHELTAAGVAYEFCDFADDLMNLKEFMQLRDSSDLFLEARREGYIGIPCILREDGTLTLRWTEYVSQDKA